jgi:hypothetical protein
VVKLREHAAAALFPMMPDADLGALAADIKTAGLREAIVTIKIDEELRVLDGRNRLRACEIAGVAPRFAPFNGEDPFAFVVSANLHRRHLSKTACAFIAHEMAKLSAGNPQLSPGQQLESDSPSQTATAKLFGISRHSVMRARTVAEHGVPELVEAVKSEGIGLKTGAELAKLPPEEQRRKLRGEKATAEAPRPSLVLVEDPPPSSRESREDLVSKTKTGRDRKHADRFATVKRLTDEGFTVTDIVERTGFTKHYIHSVRQEVLPRRGVFASFTQDVEVMGETWAAHADDFAERWGHTSAADRAPLLAALELARKAASKLIQRLKKEGASERSLDHEVRQAKAQ